MARFSIAARRRDGEGRLTELYRIMTIHVRGPEWGSKESVGYTHPGAFS
jgi:hypothetical protein